MKKTTSADKRTPARPARKTGSEWIAFGLGILASAAVVVGINYHGLTYDEPIYTGFGRRAAAWTLAFFTSLFDGTFSQHLSASTINRAWFATIDMQPPLLQVLSGLFGIWLEKELGGLLAPRLPTALFFGLAVGVLFWLTEKAFNRPAAFFASLGLIFLPRFFADAHLATLDVPVSALLLAATAAFYQASKENSWHLALFSGILLGLALLTKLNAAFLVGLLIFWAAVFYPRMLPKAAVAFFLVSPAVFFAGWPWLWHDTAAHLKEYLMFHVKHYPVLIYYFGEVHKYAPWHYPFLLTAITMPTLFLSLALVGVGESLVRGSTKAGKWLFVLCGLGYLLPSAMPFAPKYNGVRLFLPAFPFLTGLAGGGFALLHDGLARGLERIRPFARITRLRGKLAFLLGLGLLLPAVVGLLQVFPHELAYYNSLIGGPRGARKQGFETIYWGGVYLSALPALKALPQHSPRILITPQGAISLLEFYQRGGALRKDLQWVAPPPPQEQHPGWPRQVLQGVDLVVFQCAQSEFDELAWKLYREGQPQAASVYLENVPLLLLFEGDEARRLFSSPQKGR